MKPVIPAAVDEESPSPQSSDTPQENSNDATNEALEQAQEEPQVCVVRETQVSNESSQFAYSPALEHLLPGVDKRPPTPQEPEADTAPDNAQQGEFTEGDTVTYIGADGARDAVKIVQVHYDDYPNLYYTIRMEESGRERQTDSHHLTRTDTM